MKLATLCYIKSENKTLMLHRIKKENDMHKGKWNGLGGKIKPGETPEECVIREVREESGLIIKNPLLKGFLTFPEFDDNEEWRVFVYVATEFYGELIDSPEGNLAWINNPEILNLNIWGGDKHFLKWIEGEKFFSAKMNYDKGEFLNHSVVFH
ncbi:MAG: 8-oxo-dGTP diphosphatase [archaeon]